MTGLLVNDLLYYQFISNCTSVQAEIQKFQYNLTLTLKVFEFLKLKYNS